MQERGSALYQLTLAGLSVYVLIVLCAEAFFIENPEVRRVLQYIDLAICIVFLSDFFLNLYRAESKRAFLKWGWIDFVSSIPAIDPLRWGRVTRVVRILRYLRAIRSFRILFSSLKASRLDTLTWSVFLIVFFSFTLCSAFILEFEGRHESTINTAEEALWWAFINLLNAKASLDQAVSTEGMVMTTYLNKVGLLVFAYLNSIIVAWLVAQRNVDRVLTAHAVEE